MAAGEFRHGGERTHSFAFKTVSGPAVPFPASDGAETLHAPPGTHLPEMHHHVAAAVKRL